MVVAHIISARNATNAPAQHFILNDKLLLTGHCRDRVSSCNIYIYIYIYIQSNKIKQCGLNG